MSELKRFPKNDAHGRPRTAYAVFCQGPFDLPGVNCGLVYLSEEEYERQMNAPDSTWRCPRCRYDADWSDDNFEGFMDEVEASK